MTVTFPLTIEVVGLPAPQGSKRHVGRGIMVESSKKLGPWRDSVATTARFAMGAHPALDGPVRADFLFRMPMPKSRRKADRDRGWRWADKKPDADKVLRATLDALTSAAVIQDDARWVTGQVNMIETTGWTGAVITVQPAASEDDTEIAA